MNAPRPNFAAFRPSGEWGAPTLARPPVAAATEATIGSSQWALELRDYVHRAELLGPLAELAGHSGGVNPFFEPEFLSAAVDRLGEGQKRLMLLSERVGEASFARLAFPVVEDRVGLPARKALRAWSHPFAPLSTPLIDTRDAEESCDRFAALLARLQLPGGRPLVFEDLPADEATSAMFVAALKRHGLPVVEAAEKSRPCLPPDASPPVPDRAKRRKELARQLRRLGELGDLAFDKATDFHGVIVRFEEFLLVETRGWKGRGGTSLHTIRRTASFARQAIAALGDRGRATIHTLRLDGRAIASLIVLRSGGRHYPWKIAFDESYHAYSPGVQLLLHASADMAAQPGFEFADSLAREHSWADRLWPDRMRLVTLVVGRPGDEVQIDKVAAAIGRREKIRRLALRLLRREPAAPAAPAPRRAPVRGSVVE